ncbi:MAG: Si-specific NAD(P)(+) transhydrogenase [Thioalkalivibrio sp.]|nr:MAG: Si-specific NAD(P)(+) transhydrogenase [Thioalkalivibrio sp.]
MKHEHFDAIVIGSGPAGEGAAMKLVKSGRRVAVVEAHRSVGGGCTHWGTIPSKALRQAIQMVADTRRDPVLRRLMGAAQVDYPELLNSATDVIGEQVRTRNRHYTRNRVPVLHGWARFMDAHTLAVTEGEATRTFTAERFVLATGSRPYRPDDVDFSHPRIHDSDSILRLAESPSAITIYGAGVVGCEYASIFCNLAIKTNLVNTRDRLLSFLDDEITDALGYHLRNQGTVIRNNEEYERVEARDDAVILHCRSGKKFRSDVLLWANGRSGNTGNMGLEEIGVQVNHRGQVEVNELFQSSVPHIYAAGDVVGSPALASASYDQGRFVGTQIADGETDWRLVDDIPTGIYTSPEISSIGRTERELTEQRVPYEVGQANFKSIARAQITRHTVGVLKLLFHRETREILGIHCFGEQASEIIHIGQAIMAQPGEANTIEYFVETTFNYPTMAEAYRIAALNGLNRLF